MLNEVLWAVSLAEKLLSANGFSELVTLLAVVALMIYSKKSQRSLKNAVVDICTGKSKAQKTLSGKQDLVINDALSHLVFDLSASRAWVLQQHNGDYNAVTGMSFKKISMTHERTEPGASSVAKEWQNLPLGMFAHWYETIRSEKELFIPNAEALRGVDISGYQILKDNHIGALYIVGLNGFGHKEPIAFVGLCYPDAHQLNDGQIQSLRADALKICGCLLMEMEDQNGGC